MIDSRAMIRFFRWIGWDDPFLTVRGLLLIAGAILAASFGIGLLLRKDEAIRSVVEQAIDVGSREGYAAAEARFVEHLTEHPGDADTWRFLIGFRAAVPGDEATHLSEDAFLAFLETSTDPGPVVLRGWYSFQRGDVEGALTGLGDRDDAGAWFARAEMFDRSGRGEEALAAYEETVERDPTLDEARRRVVEILLERDEWQTAARRLEDPAYARVIDDHTRAEIHARVANYGALTRAAVLARLRDYTPLVLGAMLVVGLGWYILTAHLGRTWKWPYASRLLAPAAFALGFASDLALMPVLCVQDIHFPDIGPDTTFAYNLFYCVVVIGLKEEAIKLLFFLPLVPFLLGTGDRLRILTVASLVGLGFAVAENFTYYQHPGAAFGRFMTANFFHMVLTGTIGYYLVRAIQAGLEGWRWFGSEATKMVILHGIYDWVLMEPVAKDWSFAASLLFIVFAQSYLRLVFDLSPRERRPIPLTRVFVAAMALAIGVGWVLAAEANGLWGGLQAVAEGFLGTVVISAMFFREFDETISG